MYGPSQKPNQLGYTAQVQEEAIAMNQGFDLGRQAIPRDEHGLLTNQSFREVAQHTVHDALSTGRPLSVIIADLDGFKGINDSFGHGAGDRVIDDTKELLSHLGRNSKARQEIGRIGGDEFASLVLGGEEEVKKAADDLQDKFDEYLQRPGNKQFKEKGLGISVGTATLSKDMKDASDLLRAADESMYAHKVEKLGKLSRKQEMALMAARRMLQQQDIRLRDVPKHWRNMDIIK